MPNLLTEDQTAEFLKVKKQTLAAWRCLKKHGLRYIKVGGSVRYDEKHLLEWISSRTHTPVEATA